MALDNPYEYEEVIDEESAALAGAYTLAKYTEFVDKYADRLEEIELAIDESLGALWSPETDPIALDIVPYEQGGVLEIVRTRNKRFNKVLIVFASLCGEVIELETEAREKLFPGFALHGEGLTGDDDLDDGDVQKQMGIFLPTLKATCEFVHRVYEVVTNFMHQLGSLYSPQMASFFKTRDVHFRIVFEHLAKLLSLLITLEELVKENTAIKDGWTLYKRMIKTIKTDPDRYNTSRPRLRELEKTLQQIEDVLFTDMIYLNAVEQVFDYENVVNVTGNRQFKAEFAYSIERIMLSVLKKMGGPSETDHRIQYVGLVGLYGLYFAIYGDTSEKKLFKALWDAHLDVPIIHLFGHAYLLPTNFLTLVAPEMTQYAGKVNIAKARAAFLDRYRRELDAKVQALHLQVSTWMVRFESNLAAPTDVADVLAIRMSLVGQGVVLAYNLGHEFHTGVGLHTMLGARMAAQQVLPLCQMLELQKAIQHTFHRRSPLLATTLPVVTQQLSLNLQRVLLPVRDALAQSRNLDDNTIDALSGAELSLEMLDAPLTRERRILLSLGLSVTRQKKLLDDKTELLVLDKVRRLELLTSLQEHVDRSTNTASFYWARTFLPVYFQATYAAPAQAHRLPYMMCVIRDIFPLFQASPQLEPEVFHMFKDEVESLISKHILEPLCADVEKRLRNAIHTLVLVKRENPYSREDEYRVPDLVHFFKVRPLVLFDSVINIASRVAHYLDTTFYNHTSMSLYEWRKYDEMRNVARELFGLELMDVHLPGQNKSHEALDVLQIMRNIHIFVATYNYNLNTQTFVERATTAAELKTIDVQHIANSIRTHGTGIMNTTVNFTYGFLNQKFQQFSAFLYDDHILSPLRREWKWFKANREELNHIYPYEKAEQFNREIRKLGVRDGQSFLDRFRVLVTEIGNVMGYIRMIRSGGLSRCAAAVQFVPDLEAVCEFGDLASSAGLSDETKAAASLLDNHVDAMYSNFAGGADYFKVLVDVFAKDFRDEANSHLAAFPAIVPALTINFVEHMLSSKERLIMKNKEGAAYSDDGFALGVAYILQVLDEVSSFESLHWFESVEQRYEQQEAKVAAERKSASGRRARETAGLTLKRLGDVKEEFQLLYFTFSGAFIFFNNN